MVGKDQLHIYSSVTAYTRAVCENFHAVFTYGIAGCYQLFHSLDFNNADSACADFINSLEIAKVRDMYTYLLGSIHYGGTLLNGDLLAVYHQLYHLVSLPPLKEPKPW